MMLSHLSDFHPPDGKNSPPIIVPTVELFNESDSICDEAEFVSTIEKVIKNKAKYLEIKIHFFGIILSTLTFV